MKKVIFVPGFMGSSKDMFALKVYLKNFEMLYFDYQTNLEEPIHKISIQLSEFINKLNLKENEKMSIIGLSSGGVIVDYYLKFIDNRKIDKFISLFSPFKGSQFAYLFSKSRCGLFQLRKSSDFLKKLNEIEIKNINIKNIWCKFDILVTGNSGKGVNPQHSFYFLHCLVQYWPPLIKDIKVFLEK